MQRKEIRGFKILKSSRRKGYSLKLFTQKNQSFYVMLTRYVLGLPLKTRIYEFNNSDQADYCYTRLLGHQLKIFRHLF